MARVHPLGPAVVQRQHVVLGRLGVEEQLEVAKLLRVLVGQVDRLAEVLGHVIELPLVAVDHVDVNGLGLVVPGPHGAGGVVQASQPS